jgi:hypothetical protein
MKSSRLKRSLVTSRPQIMAFGAKRTMQQMRFADPFTATQKLPERDAMRLFRQQRFIKPSAIQNICGTHTPGGSLCSFSTQFLNKGRERSAHSAH